jgi:hypothetical protein
MSVKYTKKSATLTGNISVEEAETLSAWLMKTPDPAVNLGKAIHVHAAVLQVLMALKPRMLGTPQDVWLCAALAIGSAQSA